MVQLESDSSTVSSKHKDLQRLQEIFFEVAECKDDSQQRGWAVHDDEGAISGLLEELLQILVSAGVLGEWVWLTHPCNWCVRTNGPVVALHGGGSMSIQTYLVVLSVNSLHCCNVY